MGPALEADQVAKASSNPRPYILFGFVVVLSVFGGLGAWAALAPLSGAVIAPGVVVVDSNQKTVQHLEGGIVSEILVRDGDWVAQGALLVRLDDTRAAANLAILDGQLHVLRAREARLLAERDLKEALAFPADLLQLKDRADVLEILNGEQDQLEARRATLAGEMAILGERAGQFREEIGGIEIQVEAKTRQMSLIGQELGGLRQLYEKGYAPLTRILALEREAERLRGERGEHKAEIARTKGSIGEAELQIVQLGKTFREEVVAELRDTQTQIFDLSQRRVAAADDVRRVEVRAPIGGIVMGLGVHTLGGVVSPGEPILYIVPSNDTLVIEAQVATSDIDKVAPGLTSVIRLSAFNLRSTPELLGEVATVSPDRFVDEATGHQYYKARVTIDESELAKLDGLALLPGMPAEVFINTGERKALSYFVKPFTDSLARTFRDE
jgi:HlyD family type I secretion membrane fusion protein